MKITDMRQSIATLVFALACVFMFALGSGVAVLVVGESLRLDELARGWIGGFVSAGILLMLIRSNKSKRGF
jgi:hypothetical protein